ncbi:MAG TPA: hypothetical protein PKK54_01875 [bacterium]|nr:hypothetical protein [bacterium]
MKINNSKKITLLILLPLLVIGVTGCTKKNTEENISKDKNVIQKTEEVIQGTVEDIIAKGGNASCKYEIDEKDGGKIESTAYIAGSKFRTDTITVDADGKRQEFHMVSDGDWSYIWNEVGEKGVKVKYSDLAQDENSPQTSSQAIREAMKGTMYECTPVLIADQSKFNVPSDIKFEDIGETMKAMQEQSDKIMKDMCSACDQMESAAEIANCKKDLNCQ